MKNLGVLSMILGVLSTLNSTFFTIIYRRYDTLPIVLFWALLSAFELFFAWVWLISKTHLIQRAQKVTLIILIGLTIAWMLIVMSNPDTKSIFIWALKTLNFGGLYFVGLIIYYHAQTNSNAS